MNVFLAPGAPLLIPEECSAENNSVTVAWQPPPGHGVMGCAGQRGPAIEGYLLELDDGCGGEFRVSILPSPPPSHHTTITIIYSLIPTRRLTVFLSSSNFSISISLSLFLFLLSPSSRDETRSSYVTKAHRSRTFKKKQN